MGFRRADSRLMDIFEVITKYNKVLQNQIDNISVSITSGSVSDMEDYRARVGEIQGVTFALDELKALLKKVNYVEDTDST